MINVTKTYLPPLEEYVSILNRAWSKNWVTNNGELLQELELKLKNFLGVHNLLFTSNGTVPIQMALKALGIKGDVITTPFSYVATTNAILWQHSRPVFVDIDQNTLCIDANKIEEAITENTQAILATHVYGIPCDVHRIDFIARKYNLKVIYDGAHAFGCSYQGKSLLSYGDVSTCSFHATKVFHTVEGGCVIANSEELSNKLALLRSFGHIGDEYLSEGINAKNSELHAAMGLAVLPAISRIIAARKIVSDFYDSLLNFEKLKRPHFAKNHDYNYAYYPVIFSSEKILLQVKDALLAQGITCRRYFYPSLNNLPFLFGKQSCPVSDSISQRVLALPLYYGLAFEDASKIAEIINRHI